MTTVTLEGNVLIFSEMPTYMLHDWIYENNIHQFNCTEDGYRTVRCCTPLNATLREQYKVLIHRQENENLLGKKLDIREDGPDNDPTPPRGGGARQEEFFYTEAKAA